MASLDNVMKFTAQVSRDYPDMPPNEQVALATKLADEHEATGADNKGSKSIRSLVEPEFIRNGFKITIDRQKFYREYGVKLTYQNLRSAMRSHYTPTHRVTISENEREFTLTRETKKENADQVEILIQEERDRIIELVRYAVDEGTMPTIGGHGLILAIRTGLTIGDVEK